MYRNGSEGNSDFSVHTHCIYIWTRYTVSNPYLYIILRSFVFSSLSPPSHHSRTCLNIYASYSGRYIPIYTSILRLGLHGGWYIPKVYIYALVSCVRNIGISNSYPWNSRSHVSATERCNIIYIYIVIYNKT